VINRIAERACGCTRSRSCRSYAKARLCGIATTGEGGGKRRRARANIPVAPPDRISLSLHHPLAEMLMNTTRKLPRRPFPRDVGTLIVKIFCEDIYGSSPIQGGIKATRDAARPIHTRPFRSRCVTALIIESFARRRLHTVENKNLGKKTPSPDYLLRRTRI